MNYFSAAAKSLLQDFHRTYIDCLSRFPYWFCELRAALLSGIPRTKLDKRRRAPHCASRAPCRRVGAPNTGTARSLLGAQVSSPFSRHPSPIDAFHAAIFFAVHASLFRRCPLSRHHGHHDAFSVDSRKYLDGGNIPARVNSRPTSFRISSAQSAHVNSLIPRCRRAA